MTTWFTSDLHFNHKRITELTPRGRFVSSENHTEWLIDLWNSQVNHNDVVYHLGDFNFTSKLQDWFGVLSKLKGRKILLRGNHDDQKVLTSCRQLGMVDATLDYHELKVDGTKIVLCHYPMRSWNKQGYGSIMLHGHCHGSLPDEGGKILDVGLDNAYNLFGTHKFFTQERVLQYMQSRPIKTEDHHSNKTGEM